MFDVHLSLIILCSVFIQFIDSVLSFPINVPISIISVGSSPSVFVSEFLYPGFQWRGFASEILHIEDLVDFYHHHQAELPAPLPSAMGQKIKFNLISNVECSRGYSHTPDKLLSDMLYPFLISRFTQRKCSTKLW